MREAEAGQVKAGELSPEPRTDITTLCGFEDGAR